MAEAMGPQPLELEAEVARAEEYCCCLPATFHLRALGLLRQSEVPEEMAEYGEPET